MFQHIILKSKTGSISDCRTKVFFQKKKELLGNMQAI